MKKLLLIILLFSICVVNIKGQNSVQEPYAKQEPYFPLDHIPPDTTTMYFGINVGLTTGLGLSYIYWPKKDGIQATFLPFMTNDRQEYSLSLSYLRTFKQHRSVRFFGFFGHHLTSFATDEDYIYNVGIGPGLQVNSDAFNFHFMVGYGLFNVPIKPLSSLTVEIGVFYGF